MRVGIAIARCPQLFLRRRGVVGKGEPVGCGAGWPAVEGSVETEVGRATFKAALRLHALRFGRIVPYFEVTAGAGATGLHLPESQSTFTFILEGGVGLSVFLTRDLAISAGYRFQHLSNGGTSKPNIGFEANTGVVGVSFFFP